MTEAETLSAVVVTYFTGPALRDCLTHLLNDPDVTEVVVVDNGNPPDDERWLDACAATAPHVRVLRGAGNIGFGAACNLGAASAAGTWLLFVNPDLSLAPGAAATLRQFAASQGGMTLVGGRVLGLDGREHRGARREAVTPWSMLVAAFGLGRLERLSGVFRDPHREHDPAPPAPIHVAAVSGALFLMSRAGFVACGGFDEGYFLHVEDIDLCRRVCESGGAVWFHPAAVGLHHGATSRASSFVVERWKARGFERYFAKFARSRSERVLGIVAAGILGLGFRLRGAVRELGKSKVKS